GRRPRARESKGDRGQGRLLDGRAAPDGQGTRRGDRQSGGRTRAACRDPTRARALDRSDGLHDGARDELFDPRKVRAAVADMALTKAFKGAISYDSWEEEEREPEPEPEKSPPRKGRRKKKKKEKADREEIFEALTKLGYEPSYQVLDGRVQSLAAVGRADGDLIFNLTESYAGDDTKDMNIAAYL